MMTIHRPSPITVFGTRVRYDAVTYAELRRRAAYSGRSLRAEARLRVTLGLAEAGFY